MSPDMPDPSATDLGAPASPAPPTAPLPDMLTAYSAALDEVYWLRRALAYEARVIAAQTLDISRLGQRRRMHIETSIHRMELSAQGRTEVAYATTSGRSLDQVGYPEATVWGVDEDGPWFCDDVPADVWDRACEVVNR